MSNTQLFLVLLIHILGTVTNVALVMNLAGRIDRLTDALAGQGERLSVEHHK